MPFHVYVETHAKIKVCVKLGMMLTQTNVEMTVAHMNYRVSKTLIFKWKGRLREGRESLNDDSGPLMWDDIIWLNLYCPYKQGRCPISGSANDIGCFQSKIRHLFADFVILRVKKIRFIRTTYIVQTWHFLECSEVHRVVMLKGM